MTTPENNPSLSRLALQYRTITQDQYKQVSSLLSGQTLSADQEADLLLKQGLATRYQITLLKLIQEYQVLRKAAEAFGRLAVEKGYATPKDIEKALEIQKKTFRESRLKKLLGDILVETKVITSDQKIIILREQHLLEEKNKRFYLEQDPETAPDPDDGLQLTAYEKEFLRVKALDEDFSAALLEKGMAAEDDITQARRLQEDAFEHENTIRLLGDILVELRVITAEQKNLIFEAQGRKAEANPAPILHVEIRKDQMAAWIHVDPAGPGATLAEIKEAVARAEIQDGLYPDPVLACAASLELPLIPVARKDYSMALRDAQKLVTFLDNDQSENQEKKKGDLLAEMAPAESAGPFKNIMGALSDQASDLDFTLRCGSGVRQTKDRSKILAAKTGRPMVSVERFLFIHPTIHALEDVDQRYGQVEPYANLTVSGTITGAYPVTVGHVKAREIRGARIEAIGNVHSEVGITDSVIRAQGDIHARYLHNCQIETFGNVIVQNEIFDSDIRSSGKIDSPDCRIIASRIFAKQGVVLAGTGSEKTLPCEVTAGSEHHLFSQLVRLLDEAGRVRNVLTQLRAKQEEKVHLSRRTFEKMVELKIFHDRAKKTRKMLAREFKAKSKVLAADKKRQMLDLITNYERRMEKAIASMKDLNKQKKDLDQKSVSLSEKIQRLAPRVNRQVRELERTLFAYLEWARFQPGTPRVEIRHKAFQGTVVKGVFSEFRLESDLETVVFQEKESGGGHEMVRF